MGEEWNNNNGYGNGDGGDDYAFQTLNRHGRPKTLGWSLASLICGIIAAVTASFGFSGIILGVCAIIFAIVSRRILGYFDGKSIGGLILGIFGLIFGVAMLVYVATLGEEDQKFLWDWIKELFADMENGGTGT